MDKDKDKRIKKAVEIINKKFGEGSIMKLSEAPDMELETITTGALSLDLAIGIGGIPKGRIIELFGPESSGKSTLALTIAKECQKQGGIAAYIDLENAMDPQYAKNIGVDIDQLLISQPDSAEQTLDIAEELVRNKTADLIVIDSVAALIPLKEIEDEMEKNTIGLQARLMSKAMRKLTNALQNSNSIVLFINQVRDNIGMGAYEATPGGRALKFYASVRIRIKREDIIKQGDKLYGIKVKARIAKNKVSTPFKEAYFDIVFGKGVRRIASIIDAAVTYRIIEKSGSWYSYNKEKIGQGANGVAKYLRDNKEICNKIEQETRDIALKQAILGKGLIEPIKKEEPKKEEEKKENKKPEEGIL